MELDQNRKARIFAEEAYRSEVRKQLDAEKADKADKADKDGNLKKFLNSAFGLWLLSAIFISGAGAMYQNYQKRADEAKVEAQQKVAEASANRLAIERLDIEISFRVSQALLRLSTISEQVAAQMRDRPEAEQKLEEANFTFGTIQRLASATKSDKETLYPEHVSYSVPTLLTELRRRVPESDRPAIDRSLAALGALASKASYDKAIPVPLQAGTALQSQVILPRWKGGSFHYVSCSSQQPFCTK